MKIVLPLQNKSQKTFPTRQKFESSDVWDLHKMWLNKQQSQEPKTGYINQLH